MHPDRSICLCLHTNELIRSFFCQTWVVCKGETCGPEERMILLLCACCSKSCQSQCRQDVSKWAPQGITPCFTESPVQTWDRIWRLPSALCKQHNKAEGRNTAQGHSIPHPVFSMTFLQQLSSAELLQTALFKCKSLRQDFGASGSTSTHDK